MELRGGKKRRVDRLSLLEVLACQSTCPVFVETLGLRYLSKGRSEFSKNDIIRKEKCDMIQGICKLKVGLLN